MSSQDVVEEFRRPLQQVRQDFNNFWYTGTPFSFIEFADYIQAPYQSKTFNISEEGFRGPQVPKERIRHRKKIACFGSSTLVGIPACTDSETLSQQLAQSLAARGMPSDVANFGVIGYTIKHDLNLALRKLSEYDFDAVILFNGYNDLSAAEGGNIWRHYSVIEESLRPAFQWRTRSREKTKLLAHAIAQLFSRDNDAWRRIADPIQREKAARLNELKVSSPAPTPRLESVKSIFLTYLDLFATLCRNKKIPLIYSFQPSVHTTKKKLSGYEQAMVETSTDFGLELGQRQLRLERFRAAYHSLKEKAYDLVQKSGAATAVDLDDDLMKLPAGESAFYDHCHLLAPAYPALATRLAQAIVTL